MIVTGACGGIGAVAVAELESCGARVVGIDLEGEGERVLAADLRDGEATALAVASAIERLGGLDVLVNNAGLGLVQSAGDPPGEGAEAVLDVNLVGAWRVTAAALPALVASRGRVVNVASLLAFASFPFSPAYCASKRGIAAYSDCLRLEYGEVMSVTTVYPGYVKTPIHEAAGAAGLSLEGIAREERVEDAGRAIARAALGRPARDVATTRVGRLQLEAARHLPGVVDGMVRRRMRRLAARGRYADSALASGLAARWAGASAGGSPSGETRPAVGGG